MESPINEISQESRSGDLCYWKEAIKIIITSRLCDCPLTNNLKTIKKRKIDLISNYS